MLPANASKFTFELIGLADSLRILKFTGEEAISAPYVFTIDIVSENFDLTADQFLEKAGVLTLVDDNLDNRLIHGEVIQFHTQGHGDRFANYRIVLVPKCQFMALKENTCTFQEKSVPTILKQVLSGTGISGYNVKFALSGNYPKRNYCVQYNETDLAFVERLMSEEGMFYFFEHHLDHHCMVISDRNSVFGPISGTKAIPFHAKTGMAQAADSIYSFIHRTKAQTRVKCSNCSNRIGKAPPDGICPECGTRPALWEGYTPQNITLGDFNPSSTQVGLGHQLNPDGDLEHYRFPGHFETPDQAKKYASIHLEAECADLITGEGQTQCVRLLPGKLLEIKQHFTTAFNRPYLLTKVVHGGLQPQSLEEGSSNRGTEYQSTFYTMPNETPFRIHVHPKPKAYDHQTALVCGPGGEEIYTDNYGRIKVQFHWDRQGQMYDKSSLWIRVAQGFAGNGYGSMVVPRIGQEVIVQFEYGNPDRPIVTGSAFNASNPVPEGLPFNKTRTVFRSNSSPGGDGHNELRIDDKKGREQVYLHAEKDMDLRIKNDLKQHIQKDQHHIVTNQHKENIGKDKHLNVSGNSNLEVGDSLSIKVGKDLHVKSGSNHLQQAQQTHLKAATKLVVDGGMSLTVKGGGGTLFLGPMGVSITGTMVMINSGGSGGGAQSASPAAPATPNPPVNDKAGKVASPGSAMIEGGNGWMVTDHRKGGKITMPTDAESDRIFQTATYTGNNTNSSANNNANSPGSNYQSSSSNLLGMTPIQPIPIETETVNIALTYEDIENTPAIEIPYKITFKDGQERTGTLDKQGKAIETDAPVGGGVIEFGHNYNEAAVENERQSLYTELDTALNQSALNIRNSYKSALANNPAAEPKDDKTKQLREDFRKAVEAEINALRERSDAYDALPFYEAAWENTKSAAEGVGKGVTEYIPDLGELGALMDVMDIDISVMVDALATGDIDDLQRQFQAWKQRGDVGYEAASESMEVLILLLSDTQTRELLASLPQRFLEVTPTDELVEIGLAQATQTGIDAGAVVGSTVLVGAVTGPGGAIAGAAATVATAARKAGKALEAVSTVLSKLVKVLKKKRNKHQSGSIPNNKTPIPAGKKGGNKDTEDKDTVKPTIDVGKAEKLKIAYFDAEQNDYFEPALISLGISGKGKNAYKGTAKLDITPGSTKLYSDKACSHAINDKTFKASELKKGVELYVKAADLANIECKLTLDKQKGLIVKGPEKETIKVEPVNVVWPMIELEKSTIKESSSKVIDYVALQGGAKQYNFTTKDGTMHAMTYVDVWLEESNKEHPFETAEISVTATPNNIIFYKDIKGKEKYTAGSPITYNELTKENKYEKEYSPTSSGKDTTNKKLRLYIAANNISGKIKKVSLQTKILSKTNNSFRIDENKQGKAETTLKIEDFDALLKEDVKDKSNQIIASNNSKKLAKHFVALSKAGIHKNGIKTFGSSYYNVTDLSMKEGLKLIYEHDNKGKPSIYIQDGSEFIKVKLGHIPGSNKQTQSYSRENGGTWDDHWIKIEYHRNADGKKDTVLSKKPDDSTEYIPWITVNQGKDGPDYKKVIPDINFNTYIEFLQSELAEMYKDKKEGTTTIHALMKPLIKARINELESLQFIKDSIFSNRIPGFHAEVLAVNDVLNNFFKNSSDKTILNKISEVTYKLTGRKTGGAEEFPACMNCKAILSDSVRIPTDPIKA